MEGGDQEQKHTCKVCRRSFTCGRSLGGHMRSHMSVNSSSSEADEKLLLLPLAPPPLPSQSNRGFLGFGGGGAGYGLRENPKKTWRLSDYRGTDVSSPKSEKLCRECGKLFPSWRALLGHMRCHPDRSSHAVEEEDEEEDEEEEGSWGSGGAHKEVLGGQSKAEEAGLVMVPMRRRRRSKMVAAVAASPSPSVSQIERELEDVALCLMTLSRDVGLWGGIHSIAESSGEKYKEEEEGSEMGVTGFGYLRNELKRVESDASNDRVVKMDDELKKLKWEDLDWELSKASSKKSKPRHSAAELRKGTSPDQADSEFGEYTPSKRGRFDAHDPQLGSAYDGSLGSSPHKKSRFECATCNKTFHSYQALGGHRASHKRIRRGCCASKTDGSENSVEMAENSIDAMPVEEMVDKPLAVEARSKKVGRHECPICLRVFLSGQALGGHKRCHLAANSGAGGVDGACHQTIVIRQERPVTADQLDLNFPAPADEDSNIANGEVGFKPWWVGNNDKHEQLVNPISN